MLLSFFHYSCVTESVVSLQGSRFYENELKREQQVNQRIEKMMLQKAQITEQQLNKAQAQVSNVMDVSGIWSLKYE